MMRREVFSGSAVVPYESSIEIKVTTDGKYRFVHLFMLTEVGLYDDGTPEYAPTQGSDACLSVENAKKLSNVLLEAIKAAEDASAIP